MNWGLVGCGVIGERRAQNLPAGVKITHVFDMNDSRAQKLAQITGAKICKSADEAISGGVSAVIVSTINSVLFELLQKSLHAGLHVLIEKPAARNFDELSGLVNLHQKVVKIGFNHRFHPANDELLNQIQSRPEDPIMIIRAQYGNGARLGFENEWRSKVDLAGGGELLDQGVHVLDLASQFLPKLRVQTGYTKTHYWNMPVDDNAWAILSDASGATFSMHVSSSEWKNEFKFEVYTRQRKYQWQGLGRSYGVEKLTIYTMTPEMGPPQVEVIEYSQDDNSWKLENENFFQAIQDGVKVRGGVDDALKALKLVSEIYQSSLQIQGAVGHPQWLN